MRLSGLTTSVGYAEPLSRGLAEWADGLDDLLVVTTADDTDTHALCRNLGVRWLETDAFTRHPDAIFDKALALSAGYDTIAPADWTLVFDADVSPPKNGWRRQIERECPRSGTLYGARRQDETGAMLPDGELAGFLHLFHVSDPTLPSSPIYGSWVHAGAYDSAFAQRWGVERQRILPLMLTHHGQPGRNWCGVGRHDHLRELMRERNRRRGWAHERLG